MVALDHTEGNLAGVVEGLKADVVRFVEVHIFQVHDIAVLVEASEVSSLLRVDHGILGEHTEKTCVDVAEG